LITFDSGPDEYSKNTPSTFNFNTTLQQTFNSLIYDGHFGFVNFVSKNHDPWHGGALDHTENDVGGYMFFTNVDGNKDSQIFYSVVNNLCIGLSYEFSAYLANVNKKSENALEPSVRFEVRAPEVQSALLAQVVTGSIPECDNMTWSKHGLSFIASTTSVVLLMISNVKAGSGNDFAIDDIELRVCPTVQTGFCPSGWYIYYFLNMI
jgi:hypothetical protein